MNDLPRPKSLTPAFTALMASAFLCAAIATQVAPAAVTPFAWLTAVFAVGAMWCYRVDGVCLLASETAEMEETVESLREFCTQTVEETKKQVPAKDIVAQLNINTEETRKLAAIVRDLQSKAAQRATFGSPQR